MAWRHVQAGTLQNRQQPDLIRIGGRRGRIRALPLPRPSLVDRRTALARVLPLWPHELEDDSLSGRQRLVDHLRRALRAERRRGIAGHWTYDLARHIELLRLYRAEVAALSGLTGSSNGASDPHR